MKTKILFIGLSALVMTSCSDFFDEAPKVQTSTETYYSTDAEVNTAVIGTYSVLQREAFELGPFLVIGDDASDDYDLGTDKSEAFSWFGSVAQQIQSFQVLPTNWISNQLWSQGWLGVTDASEIIEKVEANNNKLSEKSTKSYLGEAYYLRGLYKYFLARQYGRLPIVDHILSYEEYFTPRATMDQTWEDIEKDLVTAATLLPKKSAWDDANAGRATQGAAYALLGKLYTYQHKWQEALNALSNVINSGEYSLEPSYASIFDLDHENGCESIFEIQHTISNTGWSDNNEGSILSFYEHDADPDDNVKWHNGWSMHCPTQDLVNAYKAAGDSIRMHATIIFPGEFYDGRINKNVASSTGYQSKKWYVPYADRSQTDQSDCPRNIIVLRYADVLLLYAEAANQLGKTDDALKYLNIVRSRVNLPTINETAKEALQQLIWNERRLEFAGEGQRFFDLTRTGQAGKVIKDYYNKWHPINNTIKGSSFKEGVSEIQPIPDSQVTLSNGSMEQNPGY